MTKPTIGTTTTEKGKYRQTATQPAKPKIKGSKKWGTPIMKNNQTTTECEIFDHDFKHLIRKGRATAFCPKCNKNVILLLVYALDAGIDLTK